MINNNKPAQQPQPEPVRQSPPSQGLHPMLALPAFFLLLLFLGATGRDIDSRAIRQQIIEQEAPREAQTYN